MEDYIWNPQTRGLGSQKPFLKNRQNLSVTFRRGAKKKENARSLKLGELGQNRIQVFLVRYISLVEKYWLCHNH